MKKERKHVDRCIILYAMPYSIADEKTGEINEGISTTYLPTDDLSPEIDDDNNALGVMTCKQTLKTDWLPKLVAVPGIYDIEFKTKSVKGKPVSVPVEVTFVSEVSAVPVEAAADTTKK